MYKDELNKIIDQQAAPMRDIVARADEQIKRLQQQVAQAETTIKELREARCPTCDSPLPADKKCIACMCRKTLPGADNIEAYRRGMQHLALAIGAVRARGLHCTYFYALTALIDEVVKQAENPDKLAVAESAAGTLTMSGVHMGPEQGIDGLCISKLKEAFGL